MYNFHKNGRDYSIVRKESVDLFYKGLSCKDISKKLVVDRHAVGRWLREAGCIYSKVNKTDINSSVFDSISTEEQAYWLGFLFADGYVSKSTAFELSLSLKDIYHLKKFKKFLDYKGKIHIDNKIGRCRIMFNDSQIVNSLKELGCINRKSLVLTFPEKLATSLYSHFIRGYFDGDGYINGTSKPILVSLIGTYSFLEAIHNILNIPTHSIKHRNSKHSELVFTNNLCGETARNFCNYIYNNATIFLERKYNRFIEHVEKYNKRKDLHNVVIFDIINNKIYNFNNYKSACIYINCTFSTLKRCYEHDTLIKKQYKVLKYGEQKRKTTERTCTVMD